jgi:hypothetical protein
MTMQAESVLGIEQTLRVRGAKRQGGRRTAAQWAKIIETQRQSGLTVVEFCRRQHLAKATYWYWRKRLVTAGMQGQAVKPAQRFLAVPIVTPVAEPIEVALGTMRVRLQGAEATRVVDAIVARVGSAQR